MPKRVIIVGAGFGGLAAARKLADADVEITLIDRRNHHLFQPLLYQVATGGLSPADIAQPIRRIVRGQQNCRVLLAEVQSVDANEQTLQTTAGPIHYDWCVLATGATHAYFGNDQWADHAPGLKSIEDALTIRRRVLLAFERAEMEADADQRKALLTFVVIGAGPTGVEMAGAIREIALHDLRHDFRWFDPAQANVILVEAGSHVLPTFPARLRAAAKKQLEQLGVEVRTNCTVTDVQSDRIETSGGSIRSAMAIWAAGVAASPLGQTTGAAIDRAGRVLVTDDLSVPGHANLFVIGDLAATTFNGEAVPGVAPAAIQGGKHVAATIRRDLAGEKRQPFRYKDKGSLATIGRSAAVADLSPRLRFSGFVAWILWWAVHILSLVDLRSKAYVILGWMWQYLTFGRQARLITNDHMIYRRRAVDRAAASLPPEVDNLDES
ncbi:MAG: NAD(P)/FAD-dependent oxidoreductase [Acidimicrobiales bacterium]|nr:NAD(P)/FAD-dependent oxidoreductase [Acidimicrobiales bacterium]